MEVQAQARGQLTVAEQVDRYAVACRPVRDVLVHYLTERSAVLDYGSLDNQAQMLVSLFWADLERHHPGVTSLHLPDDVARGWKQRVRTLPDGTPRRTFHAVLLTVRSFYLDLLQWSLEDPARWAAWAAPCPVSETDVRGYIKEARRRHARMAERTRPNKARPVLKDSHRFPVRSSRARTAIGRRATRLRGRSLSR
jgi:hypothetical protein